MQTYVAGFLFDTHFEHVALIRKEKPAWQKGKLNGIGGKIEPGETSEEAMRREFREETGMDIVEGDWHHYVSLAGTDFQVDFYFAIGNPFLVETTTDEVVAPYPVAFLGDMLTIPNLKWLIPMAASMQYESASRFDINEIRRSHSDSCSN